MFDLHALTSGGSTTLAAITTIPANDGQTAAGVPIAPNATLKFWGTATTIADTLMESKLLSQDQIDSINGEYWNPGSASTLGIFCKETNLVYQAGQRQISIRQNTGAANCFAYTIDKYAAPNGAVISNFSNNILLPQVFGGALTAITWGSQPVSPVTNIPVGKYAILGAYVHALTNYALIRFAHADFGGKKPGFPVVDESKATARAVTPMNQKPFTTPGYQFLMMGDCPTFNATSTGTGLTIDALSITADTPNVILNLVKVG